MSRPDHRNDKKIARAQEKLPDNEIRVKSGPKVGRYLRRAHDLLTGKIEGEDTVVIKGISKAIEAAMRLAELIKHKVAGLY